jgi:hypothetical protein
MRLLKSEDAGPKGGQERDTFCAGEGSVKGNDRLWQRHLLHRPNLNLNNLSLKNLSLNNLKILILHRILTERVDGAEYLPLKLGKGEEAARKYDGSGDADHHAFANCKELSFVALCANFNSPRMMKSQIGKHRIECGIFAIYRPSI